MIDPPTSVASISNLVRLISAREPVCKRLFPDKCEDILTIAPCVSFPGR